MFGVRGTSTYKKATDEHCLCVHCFKYTVQVLVPDTVRQVPIENRPKPLILYDRPMYDLCYVYHVRVKQKSVERVLVATDCIHH